MAGQHLVQNLCSEPPSTHSRHVLPSCSRRWPAQHPRKVVVVAVVVVVVVDVLAVVVVVVSVVVVIVVEVVEVVDAAMAVTMLWFTLTAWTRWNVSCWLRATVPFRMLLADCTTPDTLHFVVAGRHDNAAQSRFVRHRSAQAAWLATRFQYGGTPNWSKTRPVCRKTS